MQASQNAHRPEHRSGALASVERTLARLGAVPLACVAVSLVAGAYCYAVAVGIKNGLFGEPAPREVDD